VGDGSPPNPQLVRLPRIITAICGNEYWGGGGQRTQQPSGSMKPGQRVSSCLLAPSEHCSSYIRRRRQISCRTYLAPGANLTADLIGTARPQTVPISRELQRQICRIIVAINSDV